MNTCAPIIDLMVQNKNYLTHNSVNIVPAKTKYTFVSHGINSIYIILQKKHEKETK